MGQAEQNFMMFVIALLATIYAFRILSYSISDMENEMKGVNVEELLPFRGIS